MLIWFPLDGARERQEGVLVHCLAGISRSVTITVVSWQINSPFGIGPEIMFSNSLFFFFLFLFWWTRLIWCTKCRWVWTTRTTLCAEKSPTFRPTSTLWASCWILSDSWIRRVLSAALAISRPATAAISRKITRLWSRSRGSRSRSRKTRKSYLCQLIPRPWESIPVFRHPSPCRRARLNHPSLPHQPWSILLPQAVAAAETSSACARSSAVAKPPSPSAILPPRPLCKISNIPKLDTTKHTHTHTGRQHTHTERKEKSPEANHTHTLVHFKESRKQKSFLSLTTIKNVLFFIILFPKTRKWWVIRHLLA